jgi:hypothetical protein
MLASAILVTLKTLNANLHTAMGKTWGVSFFSFIKKKKKEESQKGKN